ncbi:MULTISPECIES: hypothetical protein [Helcococcus]|uniref:DUF3168 domain-containing protein n=1 Tax=Helcococcus bovis TaxID=3153252 RepID=A0ABW9F808_9FIRM
MTLYEILNKDLDIPLTYKRIKDPINPPFIAYIGIGQARMFADDTVYVKENRYRLEYYFTKKDEELEDKLENTLLANGYIYSKSEDIFIESENVFIIYYEI